MQLQFQPQEDISAEATTSTEAMDQCQVSFSGLDNSSIDLDELVNTIESDVETDVSDRVCHKFANSNVRSTETTDQSTSQEAINEAILTQLASIGKCLDCIEKANVCKKSVDGTKIKKNQEFINLKVKVS